MHIHFHQSTNQQPTTIELLGDASSAEYATIQSLPTACRHIEVTGPPSHHPQLLYILRHLRDSLQRGGTILLSKMMIDDSERLARNNFIGAFLLTNTDSFTADGRSYEPGEGAIIEGLHKGGIATRAGLMVDDILLTYQGQRITSDQDWPWRVVKNNRPKIDITYCRNAKIKKVTIDQEIVFPTQTKLLENLAEQVGLRILEHTSQGSLFHKPTRTKTTSQPLVSILIHAYSAKYFEAALRSAIGQSYPNIEIIVGDDNHHGEIKPIVEKYEKKYNNIRYHPTPTPLRGGGAGNRYHCFDLAKGEYIKYLCDDDLLHPDCVTTMQSMLSKYPDVSLVTSYRGLIDAAGKPYDNRQASMLFHQSCLIKGENANNQLLGLVWNYLGEPSTPMFRTEDLKRNWPYMDSFMNQEAEWGIDDLYMWASLLQKGDLIYLHQPYSMSRRHANQLSQSNLFRRHGRVQSLGRLRKLALQAGYLRNPSEMCFAEQPIDIQPPPLPTNPKRLHQWCLSYPSGLQEAVDQLLHKQEAKAALELCAALLKRWPRWALAARQIKRIYHFIYGKDTPQVQLQYFQTLFKSTSFLAPESYTNYPDLYNSCHIAMLGDTLHWQLLIRTLGSEAVLVKVYVNGKILYPAMKIQNGSCIINLELHPGPQGHTLTVFPLTFAPENRIISITQQWVGPKWAIEKGLSEPPIIPLEKQPSFP